MSEHAIYKVMRSTPINQNARRAVRQGHCSYPDSELSRAEIVEIQERLQRKLRLLKSVLGVDTKAKAKNLKSIMNGKRYGSGRGRAKGNPRAAIEFIRCGQELNRMSQRVVEIRAEKALI